MSESHLAYDLLLFGTATRYLPYFLLANLGLANRGLGVERQQISLDRVCIQRPGCDPATIWERGGDLAAYEASLWQAAPAPEGLSRLTLTFQTPTRLKDEGALVPAPPFELLAATLVRRLSLLSEHYGDTPLPDLRPLLTLAPSVALVSSETRWQDWERYSSRQNAKVKMGGFVGALTYQGDLGPFWGLLKIGETLHVGKGCVFGMGKYQVGGVHASSQTGDAQRSAVLAGRTGGGINVST